MAFEIAILPFAGTKLAFNIAKNAFEGAILPFVMKNYEKFVKYMVKGIAFFQNIDIIRIVISTRI